ncbi:MAG: DnaJ domain-containing protein [Proteobacteria bacterium]|nr:DnaJ domain-containing protein [Pseudomonadota bacterium]
MNPWKALNIQPTDDKKIIKKAYAVLIKQYKPDENPEKFKEIQAAYQMALSMRQWENREFNHVKTVEKFEKEQFNNDVNEVETESFKLSTKVVDEEQLKFEQQQQATIDGLFEQLHQLAFAPLAVKNKLENWTFIEDFYQIDDLVLKSEVAMKAFAKIAEYNLFQLESNGTLLINKKVVCYLGEVFDWSSCWESYQSVFDNNYYLVNFQFLDAQDDKKVKQQSLLYLRFKSLFSDFLLVFIIGFVASFIIGFVASFIIGFVILGIQAALGIALFEKNIFTEVYFSALILLKLIFEIKSKNKRTPGKTSTHLIIVDEFGNFCSTKQTLIRHFVLVLQLLLFFVLTLYFSNSSSDVLLIGFYAFVFVNLLLYAFTRKMLHDYVSKTQIIKQMIAK